MKPTARLLDLGAIDYAEALARQRELFDGLIACKASGNSADAGSIIMCEHPHVYTLGRSGQIGNMLVPEEFLHSRGAALFRIDRGGDITYHGPGQIVCYPILDLDKLGIGLRSYIEALEQSVVETLARFGIEAGSSEKGTGVWVKDSNGERKICAIGVRASRGVVMHGLALNVATDLCWFDHINPCGFRDSRTTSMEVWLGHTVQLEEVKKNLAERLAANLGVKRQNMNINTDNNANRVQPRG